MNDKDKFFEDIDIFCLSSIEEPFGIVLLEAMEHSIPIVSTRCGGPSEIFVKGNDAILADIKSGEDLSNKLAELIDDSGMAESMAKLAYKNLADNYDIKIVSEKLNEIISKL